MRPLPVRAAGARSLLAAFAVLAPALVVPLEPVAHLVDHLGRDETARRAHRESGGPREHRAPGPVPLVVAPVAAAVRVRVVVVRAVIAVRRAVLQEVGDPAVDLARPVQARDVRVRDAEPGQCVVAPAEQAAPLVRLQDHLGARGRGEEGDLDLVDGVRERGRRRQLDLLVEGQPLPRTADPAQLQVRRAEAPAEPPEGVEHRLLHGERGHHEGIEVPLVARPAERDVGAHPEDDAERLPVQLRRRRLPRHREREGQDPLLARFEREVPADVVPPEDDPALVLAVLGLRLDAGEEFQGDVLDPCPRLAAAEPDLSRERAARQHGPVGEHRVDRGPARAERTEQPLEHHRAHPPGTSGARRALPSGAAAVP
ncbi:hypothetical protein STTU_6129 [Streptomyces sp. Tu6071]|nr:hypothetical protein STTU_6129 [Streptomyces sp. Tu6071]